jgi:hypothetical protein
MREWRILADLLVNCLLLRHRRALLAASPAAPPGMPG